MVKDHRIFCFLLKPNSKNNLSVSLGIRLLFVFSLEGLISVVDSLGMWCGFRALKSESPTSVRRCRGLRLVDVGDIVFGGLFVGEVSCR